MQSTKMLPGQKRNMPVGLTNYEDRHGSVQDGHCRLEGDCNQGFSDLALSSGRNFSTEAMEIRSQFSIFFMR